MSRWLIRVANQPPVVVDVADERNLATEFETIRLVPHPWVQWLMRKPRYWQVTDTVTLQCAWVLGIESLPVPTRRRAKRVIGFSPNG